MNCGTPWQSHWFVSFDAAHLRAPQCNCPSRSQNHLAKLLKYAKWVQRWIRGQQKQQHDMLAFPLNILTTTKISLIAPRGALYVTLRHCLNFFLVSHFKAYQHPWTVSSGHPCCKSKLSAKLCTVLININKVSEKVSGFLIPREGLVWGGGRITGNICCTQEKLSTAVWIGFLKKNWMPILSF